MTNEKHLIQIQELLIKILRELEKLNSKLSLTQDTITSSGKEYGRRLLNKY